MIHVSPSHSGCSMIPFHDSALDWNDLQEFPSLSFLMSLSLWNDEFRGIQSTGQQKELDGEDESPSAAAVHGMVPTTLTSGWLHSVICKFMQSRARWDLVVKLLTVLRMNC